MKPAPQILRARELELRGKRVDSSEVLRGHVSDKNVGHEPDDISRYHDCAGARIRPTAHVMKAAHQG